MTDTRIFYIYNYNPIPGPPFSAISPLLLPTSTSLPTAAGGLLPFTQLHVAKEKQHCFLIIDGPGKKIWASKSGQTQRMTSAEKKKRQRSDIGPGVPNLVYKCVIATRLHSPTDIYNNNFRKNRLAYGFWTYLVGL